MGREGEGWTWSRPHQEFATGEKFEVIAKTGSSYGFGEVKIGRGYDSARQFLRENPKIRAEILKDIRKKLVALDAPSGE